MPLRPISLALAAFTIAACNGYTPPDKPQLVLHPESIGFGSEFGLGVFIGTVPQATLEIANRGIQDLVLDSVTVSGDPQFTINGPLTNRVTGSQHTFLQVLFAPQQARSYSGTITIASNAENAPSKTVALAGVGVQPSADGGH